MKRKPDNDPLEGVVHEVNAYRADDHGEEWRLLAACKNADPELFFSADREPKASYERRYREAKARYCADCMVRIACLNYAIENKESFGVWGNLYGEDLRQVIRKISRVRIV